MTEMTTTQAMADVVAALVTEYDVTDVLADLVGNCAALYPAAAVAVMINDRGGNLELLSATSHRAEEIEILQLQSETGPCVDAISTNESVHESGQEALSDRWGEIGSAITAAGFDGVHAFPMRWRGEALGGLNVFIAAGVEANDVVGQLFADVATLVVVHTAGVPVEEVQSHLLEAVGARAVVEQAKGVLAVRHGVEVGTAYDLLLAEARNGAGSLTAAAQQVLNDAASPS